MRQFGYTATIKVEKDGMYEMNIIAGVVVARSAEHAEAKVADMARQTKPDWDDIPRVIELDSEHPYFIPGRA